MTFDLAFFFAPLPAQLYQVRIEGQITDPSGAVVPNTSIEAVNTETGVKVQARSMAEGNYVLPPINPG